MTALERLAAHAPRTRQPGNNLQHTTLTGRLADSYDLEILAEAIDLDEPARQRMAIYRPLWATFWLAMLLPGKRGFERNPGGTTERQAEHVHGLLDRDLTGAG